MKKIFLFLIFWFLSFKPVFSFDEFTTDYSVRYQVYPSGQTKVNQKITLTNKFSSIYASQYSLVLQGTQVENIQAEDELGPLMVEVDKDKETTITLNFNQKTVGVNKSLKFNLSYEALNLAKNNGQVWEINIPRLSEENPPDNYTLFLAIPKSFGNPAYIRPNPVDTQEEELFKVYRFTKNQILSAGVYAIFGDFQLFDFKLFYHLENPYYEFGETEIALPPDTVFQQVAYQNLNPEPQNIRQDDDGNWLARYRLEPNQRMSVIAEGQVKIFSQPRMSSINFNKDDYLIPQRYWESDHPLIKQLALNLTNPKEIYDYVLKTLNYDYNRVKQGTERLGALKILETPEKAICMEFTDLFIALARAAGIPAREINGYAYTTNEKLRPLGLMSDVLHSWPEYWDEDKQLWIPIDPTWEETTGGVDYFSKMDLNHFAFVIHGQNSEVPYPAGSYKGSNIYSKDIEVIFSKGLDQKPVKLAVDFNFPNSIFWGIKTKGQITIKNQGPQALSEIEISPLGEKLDLFSLSKDNKFSLLPFSRKTIEFMVKPTDFFGASEGKIVIHTNQEDFFTKLKINYWLPLLIIIFVSLALFCILFLLTRRLIYGKKRR